MSQTVFDPRTTPPPPAAGAAVSEARRRWGVPRCGYYSNAMMLWIGLRFLWLAYVFVWFAAIYFFVFVPKARRASMRYLDLIRMPAKRGAVRRSWETYRHMVEFGFLMLDRAVMLARPKHGYAIACDGLEHLAQASRRDETGRQPGVLMLSAHFGNAEVAAPYMRDMGLSRPIHIVMYQDVRQGTEKFHAAHRRMLRDIHIISTTDPLSAGVKLMAALKRGEVVAMRADRTLTGRGVQVTLLGRRVEVPTGPFMTAVLMGVPVVHIYTCRLGYRRYACRISPVHYYRESPAEAGGRDERLERAAQDYADFLERVLREFPYQWSNFYDYFYEQRPREASAGEPAAAAVVKELRS